MGMNMFRMYGVKYASININLYTNSWSTFESQATAKSPAEAALTVLSAGSSLKEMFFIGDYHYYIPLSGFVQVCLDWHSTLNLNQW